MLRKYSPRIIFLALFIAAFLTAYFFFPPKEVINSEVQDSPEETEMVQPDFRLLINRLIGSGDEISSSTEEKTEPDKKESGQEARQIKISGVPFTSQAPSGQWDNPVYQDGCEEAAALIAVYWAKGKGLDKNAAENEIAAISDYEEKNYGGYHDTSINDTAARIIKGYFGYDGIEIKENISIQDIIDQLSQGRLVVAPFDGRLLGNPNYMAPGPERHNLVIIGYDSVKKEFITNDPGTRKGENYRYDEEILYNALRDYPTGYHEPIGQIKKNIIAVFK